MIEIRKDSESIGKSPFQDEIILENYFAGTNRGEVLSHLKEAMQNGVPLMVLTGDEGSGKTMICRLLEHEVSPSCKTVFFDRTVDSFEDVVRIIAMRLGLDAVMLARTLTRSNRLKCLQRRGKQTFSFLKERKRQKKYNQ